MSDTLAAKANAPKLHFGRLKQEGFSWSVHHAEIPPETEKEDILSPTFFSHFARLLKPKDEVVCLRDDMAWEAALRVICVNGTEVTTKLTRFVSLDAEDLPQAAAGDYFAKWRGPHGKWSVVRRSDGTIIKDGFDSKTESVAFMTTIARAAAA